MRLGFRQAAGRCSTLYPPLRCGPYHDCASCSSRPCSLKPCIAQPQAGWVHASAACMVTVQCTHLCYLSYIVEAEHLHAPQCSAMPLDSTGLPAAAAMRHMPYCRHCW
jgi:hypothetical protein